MRALEINFLLQSVFPFFDSFSRAVVIWAGACSLALCLCGDVCDVVHTIGALGDYLFAFIDLSHSGIPGYMRVY